MSAQDKFKNDVVAAARDLVAVAGLAHLPLLVAIEKLTAEHEQKAARKDFASNVKTGAPF